MTPPEQPLQPPPPSPDTPRTSRRPSQLALTRGRVAAIVAGLLVLLAATTGITLLVGGERHGADEHGHEDEKKGEHDEHGHGDEKKGEHDEHGGDRVKLSPAALEKAALEMLTAGPGKVVVTLALPGEISVNADAIAHVTPRVGGAVRTVTKVLGDVVKKGDVLATLDSRELAELQQGFAAAKARLDLAKSSFTRQEQLWNEKISAEKEYLAAKQAVAEAEIDYRSAARKLSAAGAGAGGNGYSLVAPLDGTIIEKHINLGEVLRDDTQAFVIADLSTLWVNVSVYAKDLPKVRVGQAVTVRAEVIGETAVGTIGYVGHVASEQTRAATARVVLSSPGAAWRPGLFVTAEVAVEEVDAAVVVSDEAVQRVEGKDAIFVQEGDAFEARPVLLGRAGRGPGGERFVEVTSGVAAGDRYVGKNSFLLKAELGKSEAGHEH